MALEFELTLAGDTPAGVLAERAFPDAEDRPTGIAPLLSADLDEKYGFDVSIVSGKNAYIAVRSDDGLLEWEPENYVSVTFRLDNEAEQDRAENNVLLVVHRVLASGTEDAVFRVNSDVLLFTRRDGELAKHRRSTWWATRPAAEQLFPG